MTRKPGSSPPAGSVTTAAALLQNGKQLLAAASARPAEAAQLIRASQVFADWFINNIIRHVGTNYHKKQAHGPGNYALHWGREEDHNGSFNVE